MSPTNNREAMEQFFHSKMGEKYTVFSEKCTNSLSVIAKVKGFKFGRLLGPRRWLVEGWGRVFPYTLVLQVAEWISFYKRQYTLQLLIMTSVSFTNKNIVFWTFSFFTYSGKSLKSL